MFGLFLLGNIGVGKSFLGNILLDCEAFTHKCSPSSVTRYMECQDTIIQGKLYSVFNLPGLVENDEHAVNCNKQEIYNAFKQQPNSVIGFVFTGGSGGRIHDEDIAAFEALNTAFHFRQESLVLILNDLPRERSATYEAETTTKLQNLYNIHDIKVCFIDHINTFDLWECEKLRHNLISVISQCSPRFHTQHSEIKLPSDKLREAREAEQKRENQRQTQIAAAIAHKKTLEEQTLKEQRNHQMKMAAMRQHGQGVSVTYLYYRRRQAEDLVKSEEGWIPAINGKATISGPSYVPPDLEVFVMVNSTDLQDEYEIIRS